MMRASLFAATLAAAAGPGHAAGGLAWPGTYVARLEATALLQTLNAELLSHDSATATLQRWCDEHGLAPGARITARPVARDDAPATPEALQALAAGPGEAVRHRRVQLACGDHVLSEADNWYLPARLTAEMNRQLDETPSPFGVVVRPLGFRRRTLAADLLFHPLAEGWETRPPPAGAEGDMPIPHEVLQHRAVLAAADGRPFSYVVETYTAAVLALPGRAR